VKADAVLRSAIKNFIILGEKNNEIFKEE